MENILQLYNIKQVCVDTNARNSFYAFNAHMLAHNIFVEYFVQTEEDYSIDEEELEEDEPEEELEEEEQNKEHMPETRISVLLTQKGKYYEFMFVRREYEILEPLEILRHVLLLVDIISKTPVEHLVQYLHTFAIDALIPHEIAEKEFKSAALKLLKMKMTLIKAAIESNNALKN